MPAARRLPSDGHSVPPFPGLPDAGEATGFAGSRPFDDAFADALANPPPLPATVPDAPVTIRVVEIGACFGGIAGLSDPWVRVCRTHDG